MENILEVNQIKKYYKIKTGLLQKTQYVKAVDDVSFSIKRTNFWINRRIGLW